VRDSYQDERDQIELDKARAAKKSGLDLEREEQLGQLEIARQAQEISEARRRAEHDRETATADQRARAERDMKLVEAQRWAGMTVEQIMVANPDLNPVAASAMQEKYKADAAALAEKFKAEALSNAGDIRSAASMAHVDLVLKQKDEMRDFMQQQMGVMQQMMQQTLQSNAQVASSLITDQARRVDKAHDTSDRREERVIDLVGRTASSVANATAVANSPARVSKLDHEDPPSNNQLVCKKCGAPILNKFCEDCGP
jgi:hypothetical protein